MHLRLLIKKINRRKPLLKRSLRQIVKNPKMIKRKKYQKNKLQGYLELLLQIIHQLAPSLAVLLCLPKYLLQRKLMKTLM